MAKGTIYLFFKYKEVLFEQIVTGALTPVLTQVKDIACKADLPADALLELLFDLFKREVLGTKRREIMRLVLTEGRRFPKNCRILSP